MLFRSYNGVGENIVSRYNKGDTVALEYRLRYNTWQTPEGEPRGRMEIIVTSSTTVRLGQISTAQRAEDAVKEAVSAASAKAEPTLEAVPF